MVFFFPWGLVGFYVAIFCGDSTVDLSTEAGDFDGILDGDFSADFFPIGFYITLINGNGDFMGI